MDYREGDRHIIGRTHAVCAEIRRFLTAVMLGRPSRGRDRYLPSSAPAAVLAPPPEERIFARLKVKILVHEAEEGGFWGEVPALPGCASQGETMEELIANLREAISGWLEADVEPPAPGAKERVLEFAL